MAGQRRHPPTLLPKGIESQSRQGDLPPPTPILSARFDSNQEATSTKTTKRKREQVSSACNNCRRRKSKCDSRRPQCEPCERAVLTCEYQIPEGLTARQAVQQKINDVQKSNVDLHTVLEILRHGDDQDAAAALRRIREAADVSDAAATISDARALLPALTFAAAQNPDGPPSTNDTIISGAPRSNTRLLKAPTDDADYMFESHFPQARDQYVDKNVFVDMPGLRFDIARWTTVSQDNRLLNHLLILFWTWDNSVERMLYRPMFEEDLRTLDPKTDSASARRFCSRFLVNALLALGCLYCAEPTTYAVPDDPHSRGKAFAEEAEKMLLEENEVPSVTLFQGLFAMFCYEGSLGEGQKAIQYFLRAIDSYKALNIAERLQLSEGGPGTRLQREAYGLSWSMWGIYATEWRASQPLGFRKLLQKPIFPRMWLDDEFPLSKAECGGFWWFPYPMSLQAQQSMKVEVREAEVTLAIIVEEALAFIVPDGNSRPAVESPQQALKLYDAILAWKYSLPLRLRVEEAVLPSAILIHVFAELMFIVILRPFAQMSKQQFGRFDPRERCCSHASRMIDAIWTYRAFAILRTEYWLNHPITVSAFIVLGDLEYGSAEMDTLLRACQCLHEMSNTLPISADCLATINAAFKRAKLQLPLPVHRYFKDGQHRKDGLMHHMVAALMPTKDPTTDPNEPMRNSLDPSFQELLNALENTVLD